MPTRDELISALRKADAAGDTVAAKRFAELIKSQPKQPEFMPGQAGQLQHQLGGLQEVGRAVGELFTGSGRATPQTEALPELHESGVLSTAPASTVAKLSPALLTATRPEEIVDIIQSSAPDVAVTYNRDAQGNVYPILTNRKTGAVAQVNRPGLSAFDVLQGLGLASVMGTGAGAGAGMGVAAKAGLRAGAAGGMASLVEAGQAAQGGEFNLEDVAIETVGAGTLSAAGDAFQAFRRMNMSDAAQRKLIDPETSLPTKQFQKALDKKDIDFGALAEGELPLVMGDKKPDKIVDDIIKYKLKTGDKSGFLHKFKLDQSGKIAADELGIEAVRQGFREGQVSAIKGVNPQTNKLLKRMLNMKRSIMADESKALDFMPSDIVGESALKRFNFIKNKAEGLRLKLDDLAKKESPPGEGLLEGPETTTGLKGLKIDSDSVVNDYKSGLEKLGVSFDGVPPKLNFENSFISEDPTSQKIIRSVTRILSKGDKVDAYDAHTVKRQIDTMLDFTKKSPSGLTDAGKKFAGKIRRSVNDSIREVSDDYAKINDELSGAITAMENFDSALKSVSPSGKGADEQVGITLQRIMSKAQSRTELKNSISGLDDAASNLGADFKEDIKALIQFNNTLDDRFGATAKGGFQGGIESALRSGPTGAIKEAAIRKAAEKAEGLIGINDRKAFDVIQKILSR